MEQAIQNQLWLKKIIDSCNNTFHFDSVDVLIELFFVRHKFPELHTELWTYRANRWNTVHAILT